MEKTGFYAGSFDPFTVRHLTIVKAAAASLKRIIIAVDASDNCSGKCRIATFSETKQTDARCRKTGQTASKSSRSAVIPSKRLLPQGLTYLLRTLRKTTLRLRKIRISSNRSADTVDIPRNCLPFRQTYAKKHFFTCPLCK